MPLQWQKTLYNHIDVIVILPDLRWKILRLFVETLTSKSRGTDVTRDSSNDRKHSPSASSKVKCSSPHKLAMTWSALAFLALLCSIEFRVCGWNWEWTRFGTNSISWQDFCVAAFAAAAVALLFCCRFLSCFFLQVNYLKEYVPGRYFKSFLSFFIIPK